MYQRRSNSSTEREQGGSKVQETGEYGWADDLARTCSEGAATAANTLSAIQR